MINLPGVLFSLISASTFGLTNAATRRGVHTSSASLALYFSLFLGVPIFFVVAWLTGEMFRADELSTGSYLWLGASGIVHFILGRYCNYRGLGIIGANRMQPVSATNLLYTVGFSILVLGERPLLHTYAGILMLMVGPLLTLRRATRRAPASTVAAATPVAPGGAVATATATAAPPAPLPSDVPRGRLVEGYIFGVLAALFYGSSPVLIRLGLGNSALGVWGATVSSTAAGALLLATLLRPGQVGQLMRGAVWSPWFVNRSGETAWWDTPFNWLLLGSVAITFSQLFRYLAISVMDVSIASPLISTAGIWGLLFSYLLNRHLESFSRNVLVGIALSVVGSIVLLAPIPI